MIIKRIESCMREIIENNIEIDLALKMWEIFNKSNIK